MKKRSEEKEEQELIRKGICISCGLAKVYGNNKRCSYCIKKESQEKKKETKAKVAKPAPQRKHTLEELSRMAYEQGISYGQLVAKMEGGKK